ncbi:hypothetical protein FRC12_002577 [Ceratobasidium sp. 428]|nr:hypothetical protein FRC12_002577 [Ceratobasidium sp. 428]
MGRTNYVTAAVWATDLQVIVGCVSGAVYVATLTVDPSSEKDKIRFTDILCERSLPIRALAYDSDTKTLALGYADDVSVRRRVFGGRGAPLWETIDVFQVSSNNSPARVRSLYFMEKTQSLLVGLDTRTAVRHSTGDVSMEGTGSRDCRIGATALSPDNSLMAVSTLEQAILIWPMLPQGPIPGLDNEYQLESGQEWHRFESYTPVALTHDHKVVCGTLDGTVVILAHTGSCLQKLNHTGHCTRRIATREHMIYVSFTTAIDAITIVAYCNDNMECQRLKEKSQLLRPAEHNAEFYHFENVYAPKLKPQP